MAWVNVHDDAGEVFQLSIDPDSLEGHPDDTRLTMAHELAHVFTALPSQVDRGDAAFDRCDTFFNGVDCFRPDSLVHRWVSMFWEEPADAIDVPWEPSVADGQARCDTDAGFFGPYSASSPEEDFAQSFAAHVFGLEPRSDGQRERLAWMAAEPELAAYRERARRPPVSRRWTTRSRPAGCRTGPGRERGPGACRAGRAHIPSTRLITRSISRVGERGAGRRPRGRASRRHR